MGAWNELSVSNGLLLKAHECAFPMSYMTDTSVISIKDMSELKNLLHSAQSSVYWPGIDADITEYVK